MNTRIYNVRILTMEEGKGLFVGEVWIKNDTITYVGPYREDCDVIWDKEIDGQGNLLMPGFKNAHTHSAMTFLRSYADDMKLDDWLNKQVFPAEAKLDGESIYWFTKLAIMEYLTSGITSAWKMVPELSKIPDSAMYFVTVSIILAEQWSVWKRIIFISIRILPDRSAIGLGFMRNTQQAGR